VWAYFAAIELFLFCCNVIAALRKKPSMLFQVVLLLTGQSQSENAAQNTSFLITTGFYALIACVMTFLGQLMKRKSSVNATKEVQPVQMVCTGLLIINTLYGFFETTVSLLKVSKYGLFLGIILRVCFGIIICGIAIKTVKDTRKSHVSILTFHDFLIDFRHSPRSKALRRHLPSSMVAVAEVQSAFEASNYGSSYLHEKTPKTPHEVCGSLNSSEKVANAYRVSLLSNIHFDDLAEDEDEEAEFDDDYEKDVYQPKSSDLPYIPTDPKDNPAKNAKSQHEILYQKLEASADDLMEHKRRISFDLS
jgi:hypothetical protein